MNAGDLGPENALSAAVPPVHSTPEERHDALLLSVGLKTPDGAATPEYLGHRRLFVQTTGSPETPLGEAQFVALAAQHFGFEATWATAAFRACDCDGSGWLNPHEFALLTRALVTFDAQRDSALKELVDLRHRTLFARFARPIGVQGCVLDAAGRAQLVRALAAGESHVYRLLSEALRWPADDSVPAVTFAQYKVEVDQGALSRALLHTRDAFARGVHGRRARCRAPFPRLAPRSLGTRHPSSGRDGRCARAAL
eukprot:4449876-Prymnesium_polylepis.1